MIMHRFWRIFWVDATNAETMELSLQDLANDPDARASGVEHSAKSGLLWLSRIQHDWLLVFDNVDGHYNRVAEYMPVEIEATSSLTAEIQTWHALYHVMVTLRLRIWRKRMLFCYF